MPGEFSSNHLTLNEKVLLAHGGGLDAAENLLEVLAVLSRDSEEQVWKAAQESLRKLPDEHCLRMLESAPFRESVARYFLAPDNLRETLLPFFLTHPQTPPEAIAELAATGRADVVAMLLPHIDCLPDGIRESVRDHAALGETEDQEAGPLSPMEPAEKAAPFQGEELNLALEQLNHLIARASDPDEEVRRGAEETLTNLSEAELIALLPDPRVEEAVLRYFLEPNHIRPGILAVLLAHPQLPQESIVELARTAGADMVPALLDRIDLLKTPALKQLKDNPTYLSWQKEPPADGYVIEVDLLALLIQEMENETTVMPEEYKAELEKELASARSTGAQETGSSKPVGIVQKIAHMRVAERMKLALLGTREERAMLIRDPSKVVFRAVLGSPKLTEAEVEGFASQKNVSQDVLRLIAMNRKFMKKYKTLRNLVFNPRLPIDMGVSLLNRLIITDLRILSTSRDIPDTTRNMAAKLFKGRQSH